MSDFIYKLNQLNVWINQSSTKSIKYYNSIAVLA